jgi:hypothetical protein
VLTLELVNSLFCKVTAQFKSFIVSFDFSSYFISLSVHVSFVCDSLEGSQGCISVVCAELLYQITRSNIFVNARKSEYSNFLCIKLVKHVSLHIIGVFYNILCKCVHREKVSPYHETRMVTNIREEDKTNQCASQIFPLGVSSGGLLTR